MKKTTLMMTPLDLNRLDYRAAPTLATRSVFRWKAHCGYLCQGRQRERAVAERMTIHEGRFLGEPLVPFYVALVGLGLLTLIGSGAALWSRFRGRSPAKLPPERQMHRFLAPIALLPLVVSASTGLAYRLSITWLGFSEERVKFLMTLHQGSYLGSVLRPFYVLLVGAGLFTMLLTGVQMLGLVRRRGKAVGWYRSKFFSPSGDVGADYSSERAQKAVWLPSPFGRGV